MSGAPDTRCDTTKGEDWYMENVADAPWSPEQEKIVESLDKLLESAFLEGQSVGEQIGEWAKSEAEARLASLERVVAAARYAYFNTTGPLSGPELRFREAIETLDKLDNGREKGK